MDKIAKVTISEAGIKLRIHASTLRWWENQGLVVPDRTAGGRRRYDLLTLMTLAGKMVNESGMNRTTIAYTRGSRHDQKADLIRQSQVLESFCAVKGWEFELVQDLGSGLNYGKRGLKLLLKRICQGEVDRLVLTKTVASCRN